jgi:hypothetical protein
MKNNKKMRILTKNDRMPTHNLVMVLKKKCILKYTKGTSLNMTFSLKAKWVTKRLRVEGLGIYNVA